MKGGAAGFQYDVYSRPLDPDNNMSRVANQLPGENQEEALSTERLQSTIPKVVPVSVCMYNRAGAIV